MPPARRRKQKEFMEKAKRCRYCRSTENLTLDHKVAKINGGADRLPNYQALCMECNGTKSDLDHKRLMTIARWVYRVNKKREAGGKPPLGVKKKELRDTPPNN